MTHVTHCRNSGYETTRHSPEGSVLRERPQGDGGRGVKTHLRPNPYQALRTWGRSRHGPSRRCATGNPAAEPQDVAAPQDQQDCRCGSRAGQSVNRAPTSFSHSGAAVSRSAGTVQSNSGESASLARRCRHAPARNPADCQVRLPRTGTPGGPRKTARSPRAAGNCACERVAAPDEIRPGRTGARSGRSPTIKPPPGEPGGGDPSPLMTSRGGSCGTSCQLSGPRLSSRWWIFSTPSSENTCRV